MILGLTSAIFLSWERVPLIWWCSMTFDVVITLEKNEIFGKTLYLPSKLILIEKCITTIDNNNHEYAGFWIRVRATTGIVRKDHIYTPLAKYPRTLQ